MTKRGSDVSVVLKREFGDLPVVEARRPLRLQPQPCDEKIAVPRDPRRCVYSRCVRRQFGATRAVFFKTVAYIDLVGEDGVRVERFLVTGHVRRNIEKFDRGEPLEVGRGFVLLPPTNSVTRRAQSKAAVEYAKTPSGKARRSLASARRRLTEAETALTVVRERAAATKPRSPKAETMTRLVQHAEQCVTAARRKVHAVREAAKPVLKFGKSYRRKTNVYDLTVRNGVGRHRFATSSHAAANA